MEISRRNFLGLAAGFAIAPSLPVVPENKPNPYYLQYIDFAEEGEDLCYLTLWKHGLPVAQWGMRKGEEAQLIFEKEGWDGN